MKILREGDDQDKPPRNPRALLWTIALPVHKMWKAKVSRFWTVKGVWAVWLSI